MNRLIVWCTDGARDLYLGCSTQEDRGILSVLRYSDDVTQSRYAHGHWLRAVTEEEPKS